uniref:Uncharacterized protein n=1 Tax=Lepeophtheirus salmonis TaxID=72036 RepID=A0A0K2T0N0_LEPSM
MLSSSPESSSVIFPSLRGVMNMFGVPVNLLLHVISSVLFCHISIGDIDLTSPYHLMKNMTIYQVHLVLRLKLMV